MPSSEHTRSCERLAPIDKTGDNHTGLLPENPQPQDLLAEHSLSLASHQLTAALKPHTSALLGLTFEAIPGSEQNTPPLETPPNFAYIKTIQVARRELWEKTGYVAPIAGGVGRKPIELPTDEVVQLYEQGVPVEEIAQKFGVDRKTIRNRLRDEGVALAWGGYRWQGKDKEGIGKPKIELPLDEIRRLYEEEQMTAEAIARMYGCFEKTIRVRLRAMGVQLRRGRPH